MSDPVRPGVELGVGQPLAFAYDGDRFRGPRSLRLDELVHAFALRDAGLGRVPFDQNPMALGRVEPRQEIDLPRLVRRQARLPDRRRCGSGAPERFPRLTIGKPQCRPQNCCRMQPNFSFGAAPPNGPAAPPDLSSHCPGRLNSP
jgi:hypothetical protein